MSDPIQQFEARLQEAGLVLSAGLQADGRLHRCGTTDKPKGSDASYVVHLDNPPSVWWQNWRTGDVGTWCVKPDKEMSNAERQALRERIEAAKAEADADRAKRQADTAKRATVIWDAALPATADHPYLAKKQVPSLGLRLAKDGRLIIPLLDESGKVISIQFIDGSGNKRFLSGGKTAGCYFPIPAKDGGKDGALCIAEGYATCATIHEATGYAVLVAFNVGNLLAVAQMARRRYPEREIFLCADRDSPTDKYPSPGGVGLAKATEAARAIGGMLAIPRRDGHTKIDFNDLACLMGTGEVLHQIMARREPDPMPEAAKEGGKPDKGGDTDEQEPQIMPAVPKMPEGIFHPAIEAVIDEAVQSFGVSRVVPVATILALAAGLIGQTRSVEEKASHIERGNLYLLLVGQSGTGKSPLARQVFEYAKSIDADSFRRWKAELEEYTAAIDSWKKQKPDKRGTMPGKPIRKQVFYDTITVETLLTCLSGNPLRGLWYTDEIASSIAAYDKYSSGKNGGTQAYLNSLYDAESIIVNRRNDEHTISLEHGCVSIFGTIQPELLKESFSMNDRNSGFLGRFLMFRVVEEMPRHRNQIILSEKSQQTIKALTDGFLAFHMQAKGFGGLECEC